MKKLTVFLFSMLLMSSLLKADSIERVGACATPGQVFGVHVQGDYAYAADGSRLTIINIVDPSNPYVVSNITNLSLYPAGVFVQDSIAYHNNHLYPHFPTVNIADPQNPYFLGWCSVPSTSGWPKGIFVKDTIAYLAHTTNGVQIINVAQPDSPYIITTYDTPYDAFDVRVRDTLLFIADGDSFRIANVASPDNPFHVGACDMLLFCTDVDLQNDYAFTACGYGDGTNGRLVSVDISDPSSPFIVDEVLMNGNPFAVHVLGDYAYIAAGDYWNPKCANRGKDFRMTGSGNGSLRADVEGGLRIVDISNPSNLVLLATYDTPGWPEDVFVVSDLAYIADEDSLQILRHVGAGVKTEKPQKPEIGSFVLSQNYPNPFTSSTKIEYHTTNTSNPVLLQIYDVSGRIIITKTCKKANFGINTFVWDGCDNQGNRVSNGIYYYKVNLGERSMVKKCMYLNTE